MNQLPNYEVPAGYRKAQGILLHDDQVYLAVDWTPESDERPFFREGYYHFHPFMGDDAYPEHLGQIKIDTLSLKILINALGKQRCAERRQDLADFVFADLPLFTTKHIERYGRNEAYGLRHILALYIRLESRGVISILVVERYSEFACAPVVKREITYHGTYSIYWGAQEVSV